MKNILHSRLLVLLTTCLLIPNVLFAASAVELFDDSAIQNSLNAAEQQLQDASTELEVDAVRDALPKIKSHVSECITKTKNQIEQLSGDLKAIGESAVGDTVDIIGKREDLNIELGRVKETNFNCKEMESDLEKIFSLTATKKNSLTKKRLTAHNFSIMESLKALPGAIPLMASRTRTATDIGIPDARNSFSTWFIGLLFACLYWHRYRVYWPILCPHMACRPKRTWRQIAI